MVYVEQDRMSRKWGYQIIENSGGAVRILSESYHFLSPTEVFEFVGKIKAGEIKVNRDPETRSWGYVILIKNNPPYEEYGFDSSESVQSFINDLNKAVQEGVKMKPNSFNNAVNMRIS